jgi:hypothetical protein
MAAIETAKQTLSLTAAAALVGLSVGAFRLRAQRIHLPYVVVPGGRIRYRADDVKRAADRLRAGNGRVSAVRVSRTSPAHLRFVEQAIAAGQVIVRANGRPYITSNRDAGLPANRQLATAPADAAVWRLVEQGRAVIGDDGVVRLTDRPA